MRALLRHPAGKIGLALLIANEIRGLCVAAGLLPALEPIFRHLLGAH